MVRLFQLSSLVLLLLFSVASQAVEITAELDSSEISVGDSVKLTVSVDEQSSGKEPDFSPLKQHFDILSTVRSSSSNIINGRFSSTSSWILTLLPKQKGYVAIPPIQYGNISTKPLKLHVVKRASSPSTGGDFLFLDASVDKKEAYVQEQIIYTLRIFRADIDIFDHTYNPPEIKNGVMEQLGEQRNYQSTINGRVYNVIELRYAVFPQKSGQLEIPPAEFIGTVFRSRSRNYSFDPLNGKQVRRLAPDIEIKVVPKPASYPKDKPWLPASSLKLEDNWSLDTGTANIGDPITRTITIRAEGLLDTVLPSLPESQVEGIKIYPEQPESDSTVGTNGIISTRSVSQAIIATQTGTKELPEINVTWWDVSEEKLKVATLPAHSLVVSGTGLSQTDSNANPKISAPPNPMKTPVAASPESGVSNTWQWLALVFLLLWVMTSGALLWFVIKNKRSQNPNQETKESSKQISLRTAKETLKQACQTNQASAARSALIQVIRLYCQDSSIRNLQHISERLAYAPLTQAMTELEQHLYRQEPGAAASWKGNSLLDATEQALKQSKTTKPQKEPLAPLHPC